MIAIKKLLPAVLALTLLTACGDTSKVDSLISQSGKESSADVSSSSAEASSSEAEQPQRVGADAANGDIDVDLTILDSNIVYAQVFDMVNNPDNYRGKRVKATGTLAHTTDTSGTKDYFAVFIADASACCQQGLEFERAGDFKYPDDYPEIDSEITVTGEFDTYMEGDYQYCVLRNAEMTAK